MCELTYLQSYSLFVIAKNLEATQMSVMGEWLKKLWNVHMMKYSTAIKKFFLRIKLYLQGYGKNMSEYVG